MTTTFRFMDNQDKQLTIKCLQVLKESAKFRHKTISSDIALSLGQLDYCIKTGANTYLLGLVQDDIRLLWAKKQAIIKEIESIEDDLRGIAKSMVG
jgi:hypothetical protein